MFPRIKTYQRKGKTYEYLVISESVHQPGKGSTTKDIAILGNIQRFKRAMVRTKSRGDPPEILKFLIDRRNFFARWVQI